MSWTAAVASAASRNSRGAANISGSRSDTSA